MYVKHNVTVCHTVTLRITYSNVTVCHTVTLRITYSNVMYYIQ